MKHSTSMNDKRQRIREHHGFQSSGVHFFLDLANFKLQTDDIPEDLSQRLTASFDDNLLFVNGDLIHHGKDLSPALENTIL